jgi:hypothetical protein
MQPIRIVRPADATDERVREAFRDIKGSLRVPVVSALFQAWAAVPDFLDVVWRRLRPNVVSPEFGAAAARLEAEVREAVAPWPVADHASRLRARTAGEADLSRMREIVALFAEVNPKLVIVACAVERALTGEPVGGVGTGGPRREEDRELPREFRGVRFSLVEERDAPPRVRAIYEDMRTTLGVPLIETEYQAMASYPDWLDVWWRDCKPMTSLPAYANLAEHVAARGRQAAQQLPLGLFLHERLLEERGIEEAQRTELQRVTSAFVRSLPQLILNIEIARRGLG